MNPYATVKQPVGKSALDGTESGISIQGAKAIRVIARAPLGQTFDGDLQVNFGTVHHRFGFLAHSGVGGGLPTRAIVVDAGVATGRKAVLVAEIPVYGDYDDRFVALITSATFAGTVVDPTEDGSVFIELERLER